MQLRNLTLVPGLCQNKGKQHNKSNVPWSSWCLFVTIIHLGLVGFLPCVLGAMIVWGFWTFYEFMPDVCAANTKIVVLWGSLMAMTAILAGLTAFAMPGRICVHNIDWEFIIRETIEGIAGGAMLCMLVCVAIPESFHLADDYAGLMTLLGFLATLFVIAVTHEGAEDFSCF
eukprot:c15733_g1_i1.p1 GENE.c15733_g1_i1~~c15733_g1_i1.p1  ORF type:complete len:172 (+),score=34.61 c15733_g1_i1:356-871(+)